MCADVGSTRRAIFKAVHSVRKMEMDADSPRPSYRASLLRRDPARWTVADLDIRPAEADLGDSGNQLYAWLCYLGPDQSPGPPPDVLFETLRGRLGQYPADAQSAFAVQLAVAYGCGHFRCAADVTTSAWSGRWERAERALSANIAERVQQNDSWLAGWVAGYPGSKSCPGLPDSNVHVAAILRGLLDPLAPLPAGEMKIACLREDGEVRGEITLAGKRMRPLLRGNKRLLEVREGGLEVTAKSQKGFFDGPTTLRLSWCRDSGGNDHLLLQEERGTKSLGKLRIDPDEHALLVPAEGNFQWGAWECGCGRLENSKCLDEHRLSSWWGWIEPEQGEERKPHHLWAFVASAIRGPSVPVTSASFVQGMYYATLNSLGITQ